MQGEDHVEDDAFAMLTPTNKTRGRKLARGDRHPQGEQSYSSPVLSDTPEISTEAINESCQQPAPAWCRTNCENEGPGTNGVNISHVWFWLTGATSQHVPATGSFEPRHQGEARKNSSQ